MQKTDVVESLKILMNELNFSILPEKDLIVMKITNNPNNRAKYRFYRSKFAKTLRKVWKINKESVADV